MTISNVNGDLAQAVALPNGQVTREQPELAELDDVRQAIADVQAKAAEIAEVEKPSAEDIRAATEELSKYIQVSSRALNIAVDQDLREPIVTVLDRETEQVIRQIPSEELVAIAKFLRGQEAASLASAESISGVLISEET